MALNPLLFVLEAHKMIQRKRKSLAVLLTGMLLQMQHKIRGHEAVAKHLYNTTRKSSVVFSNIVGPVEQIAMANHPVKGLYFAVIGGPENLAITMVSYMRTLRVTFKTETGFMNEQKLKSCIAGAFDTMLKAVRDMPTNKF